MLGAHALKAASDAAAKYLDDATRELRGKAGAA